MCRALAEDLANELNLQANMSDFVSNFVYSLRGINSLYVGGLFSGVGNSSDELSSILSDGIWLNSGLSGTNLYDMNTILSQAIYSQLLPMAWGLNGHIHPVIM